MKEETLGQSNPVWYPLLIQTLRLIASDAEIQISSLPEFVNVSDEIAMTYDYCIEMIDWKELSGDHIDQFKIFVDSISDLFSMMYKSSDEWSDEALATSAQWQQARLLAHKALASRKEPVGPPDLSWITYVRAD